MSAFEYPRDSIRHWTPVIWSPYGDGMNEVAGYVTRPKTDSVDCVINTESGPKLKHDCMHADDPVVKEKQQQVFQRDRGVFRIAPSELERLDVMARLMALEKAVEPLLKQPIRDLRPKDTGGGR